jgi:hypothetical protein
MLHCMLMRKQLQIPQPSNVLVRCEQSPVLQTARPHLIAYMLRCLARLLNAQQPHRDCWKSAVRRDRSANTRDLQRLEVIQARECVMHLHTRHETAVIH